MQGRLIVLATALSTAGCLGASVDPAGVVDEALALVAPVLECPPGETVTNPVGLCVGTLQSATESYQEPYLAIDPLRPNVRAVGMNVGHTREGPITDPRPGFEIVRMDVFISEDAGATWRLSTLPPIPLAAGSLPVGAGGGSGDPALAFDENGVLHLSGIAAPNIYDGYTIFYASTADLGATWTTPVVLSGDFADDRNWMVALPGGRLFVPWQNVPAGSEGWSIEMAWSEDGGATWRNQEADARALDCGQTTDPVVLADRVHLACSVWDGDEVTHARIMAFDPAVGRFATLSEVESTAYWPELEVLPDGSLALLLADYEDMTTWLRTSADGGRTWTEPVDLGAAITLDDAWDGGFDLQASKVDANGALHLVVVGDVLPVDHRATFLAARHEIAHVVLDARTGALLAETLLAADEIVPVNRLPPPPALPWGDHTQGLAFVDGKGVLVWTRERGLDYADLAFG